MVIEGRIILVPKRFGDRLRRLTLRQEFLRKLHFLVKNIRLHGNMRLLFKRIAYMRNADIERICNIVHG